jgi:hypothetical protein
MSGIMQAMLGRGAMPPLKFTYTAAGGATYTVPAGYTSLTAKVWGGGGEGSGGGAIVGTRAVLPGDVIHTRVGGLNDGSAVKVVRSSTILGKLLAGAGGGGGDSPGGGAGGGLNGGNGGNTSSASGGTGATRSAAGTGVNNGGGPYDFTTFGDVNNGGARPGATGNGFSGGPGGGGYYGGGSGASEEDGEDGRSSGGGGGSGYDEGFSSVATYQGDSGGSALPGNFGDVDKPASIGGSMLNGAVVLLLA